jgi:thiol-disulfide isomerase/thioredoxin
VIRSRLLSVLVGLALGVLLFVGWDAATGGPVSEMLVGGDVPAEPLYPSHPRSEAAQAPDIALPTLGGKTFRLSEHRGEVVILNFWATWCPPCRREIPDLIAVQQVWGDEGVRVVGVSVDRGDPVAVRRYVREAGVNYDIVIDDGSASQAFGGVRMIPTTYIIGRSGRIRGRVPGLASQAVLESGLPGLLAENASAGGSP